MKKKIGLLFGSFNPIHIGHLIIGNIASQTAGIDEVWFVVSPQNPMKRSKTLLHEFDRLDMVRAAIQEDYHFKASDIEFHMPKPSYTIDTLAYLSEKYPEYSFQLIIGEDNLDQFPRWKNHEIILKDYGLIVYPRPNASHSELKEHPSVQLIDAPKIDISATLIRKLIRNNKSIKYLVPKEVEEIILSRGYFVN